MMINQLENEGEISQVLAARLREMNRSEDEEALLLVAEVLNKLEHRYTSIPHQYQWNLKDSSP